MHTAQHCCCCVLHVTGILIELCGKIQTALNTQGIGKQAGLSEGIPKGWCTEVNHRIHNQPQVQPYYRAEQQKSKDTKTAYSTRFHTALPYKQV